jgi:hypothetical protein
MEEGTMRTLQQPGSASEDGAIRAHSTPDPSDPELPPPQPRPDPDDVPAPARAPVQEPDAPTPPVKAD